MIHLLKNKFYFYILTKFITFNKNHGGAYYCSTDSNEYLVNKMYLVTYPSMDIWCEL